MTAFSHLNKESQPLMVDVSEKKITSRRAVARGTVSLPHPVFLVLQNDDFKTKKGSIFQTAIIAGILAAKRTGELIPLCHPLGLENCEIHIQVNEAHEVVIDCMATIESKTGVEMEALTGVSIAALTIYDMCKSLSHDIKIRDIMLIEKTGGKHDFKRD